MHRRWNGNSKSGLTNLFEFYSYFLGPVSYKGQPVCYNVINFFSSRLFFHFPPLLPSENTLRTCWPIRSEEEVISLDGQLSWITAPYWNIISTAISIHLTRTLPPAELCWSLPKCRSVKSEDAQESNLRNKSPNSPAGTTLVSLCSHHQPTDTQMKCCKKSRKNSKQRPNQENNNNKKNPYFATCPQTVRQCSEHKTFNKSLDLRFEWRWKFCFPKPLLLHSRLDESYAFKKRNQNKKNTHIQADEDQVFVQSDGSSRAPWRPTQNVL